VRILTLLAIAVVLALAACGDDGEEPAVPSEDRAAAREETPMASEAAEPARKPKRRGTRLRIGSSEFGRMLFDARRQAIYIFERDPKGRSVCRGECARAWPPVLTRGEPVAGRGVRASLLGTIRRRGGRRQVTYAGKPLYFYAHEGPGEVLCHNVNLNGGLWWVVGPSGRRRA
jgi:predicted lipoprotein with Yx(FWY)xxD motif